MPLPPFLSMLPQTAADLLDSLLRSQLFAESIFGQIREQSKPYLDRPADEFAAALVQKSVLMPWQAGELLAGRMGMYAGTYRLLERLVQREGSALFVAEQSGPQRLVLLNITWAGSEAAKSAESADRTPINPVPYLLRCIEVQRTRGLLLEAYEFFEARTLQDLRNALPTQSQYAADLVRQYALAIGVLPPEILDSLGPERVLIDHRGLLKLLARQFQIAAELPDETAIAKQMATVNRFAMSLGGVPEMVECRTLTAVIDCLTPEAQPWSEAFPRESLRCPRVLMNRLLRKGPALRLIEAFGPELQVMLGQNSESGLEPKLQPAPDPPKGWTPTGQSGDHSAFAKVRPPISALDELAAVIRQDRQSTNFVKKPSARGRGRALLITALFGMVVAGVLATMWFERWGVRKAGANSGSPPQPIHAQRP